MLMVDPIVARKWREWYPEVTEQEAQYIMAQGGERRNAGVYANHAYNLITMPNWRSNWKGKAFIVKRPLWQSLGPPLPSRRGDPAWLRRQPQTSLPPTRYVGRQANITPAPLPLPPLPPGERAGIFSYGNNENNGTSKLSKLPLERQNSSKPNNGGGGGSGAVKVKVNANASKKQAVTTSPAEERRIQRNVTKNITERIQRPGAAQRQLTSALGSGLGAALRGVGWTAGAAGSGIKTGFKKLFSNGVYNKALPLRPELTREEQEAEAKALQQAFYAEHSAAYEKALEESRKQEMGQLEQRLINSKNYYINNRGRQARLNNMNLKQMKNALGYLTKNRGRLPQTEAEKMYERVRLARMERLRKIIEFGEKEIANEAKARENANREAARQAAKANRTASRQAAKAKVLAIGSAAKAKVVGIGKAAADKIKQFANWEMAMAEERGARAEANRASKNKAAAEAVVKKAVNAKAAAEEALKKAAANKTARRADLIRLAKARKSAAAKAMNNAENWLNEQNKRAEEANKLQRAAERAANNAKASASLAASRLPRTESQKARQAANAASRAEFAAASKALREIEKTNLNAALKRAIANGNVEAIERMRTSALFRETPAGPGRPLFKRSNKQEKVFENALEKARKVASGKRAGNIARQAEAKRFAERAKKVEEKGKGRAPPSPPKPQPTKEEINKLRRQAEQAETEAKKFANIAQGAGSSGLTREQLRQAGVAANNARQAAAKKAANNARRAAAARAAANALAARAAAARLTGISTPFNNTAIVVKPTVRTPTRR